MNDPGSKEFRDHYLQFVELTLDYGTDTEGQVVENAIVPIPARMAFELMELSGDVLSRLAAVALLAATLRKLAPITGTDRSIIVSLERIADPDVDPVEYLRQLESWAARH